jgi:hypothetical protein
MLLFTKVSHGFACRGDMDDPYQRKFLVGSFLIQNLRILMQFEAGYVKEASFRGMVDWFNFWLPE